MLYIELIFRILKSLLLVGICIFGILFLFHEIKKIIKRISDKNDTTQN